MLPFMGMLDRDYYQEHWFEKVLGVKPKPKSQPAPAAPSAAAPERGPIYVNRSGTASRSMHPDPRLSAVYAHRAENARTWRRILASVAGFVVLVGVGYGSAALFSWLAR